MWSVTRAEHGHPPHPPCPPSLPLPLFTFVVVEEDDASLLGLGLFRVDEGGAHNVVGVGVLPQLGWDEARGTLVGHQLVGVQHWGEEKQHPSVGEYATPWEEKKEKKKKSRIPYPIPHGCVHSGMDSPQASLKQE